MIMKKDIFLIEFLREGNFTILLILFRLNLGTGLDIIVEVDFWVLAI